MKIKTLAFPIQKTLIFLGFFVITAIVPLFLHEQWITGPLINAALILACVLIGPMEAVLLGLFPSAMALTSGLLPMPFAPMVPFIIIGNALFVAVFHYFREKNFWFAVFNASIIKFLFLFGSVIFIMQGLLASEIVEKLSVMMSWPQLVTALLGGLMAYGVLKIAKKETKNER